MLGYRYVRELAPGCPRLDVIVRMEDLQLAIQNLRRALADIEQDALDAKRLGFYTERP